MPPKRRSPRDTTITNTRASKATKILEPTPEALENNINILAVETDHGSDADLDAEATANILNLPTKRKPTPHRTEPLLSFGSVRNIARRLFVSQEEDEPTEAGEEEVRQPDDQIMEEASTHFPYVQAPPVTEPPAKITLDRVSDVESPHEDEHVENLHKRGKGRAKGKQPLVAPRTTDGQTLQVVVRPHSENMPSSTAKKPPGRKSTKGSQRNLKSRVARSKKAASPVSEGPADNQELIPNQPVRRISPRKSTTRVSAGGEMPALPSVAPLDYEEGITDILMNPSPIKVTRQNLPKKSQSKAGRPSKRYGSLSDGEGENPVENDVGIEEDLRLFVEDDQQVVAQRQKEDSIESTELHSMIVDSEILDSLIDKARRVGHTAKRGTKDFEDVSSVNRLTTQGGEKIQRRLDKLVSDYEKLESSKSKDDEDAAKEARENIATKLQSLTEYASRIVTVKLNGKANEDMVMKLLKDIYFYVLPNWLDCIKLASECYDEDGSMSTRSLKEIHAHLKSWCELAESAISQPTNIQPKGGYQTSKPTREILPQIHKLRRSFHAKISAKFDANPIARALRLRIEREKRLLEEEEDKDQPPSPSTQDEEVQRLKLELARVRREKEERAERAKRQRKNEIHRRQVEQIREALVWQRKQDARVERRAREKLERGSRGYLRSRTLQHKLVDLTREEEEDDDDPFADDYQVRPNGRAASVNLGEEEDDGEEYEDEYQLERVEVFPHNNKSRTTPMPWSDTQKLVFVNCMIRGGRDKYERAAEKLQCSMDEVFAAAKELQEAHDKAHAAGQLNGPDDGWTYDVWVEQG